MQVGAGGENTLHPQLQKNDSNQRYEGTVAERLHKIATLSECQKLETAVECEGEALKNCFHFKYLGDVR